MPKYILKRFVLLIPAILGIIFIMFLLMYILPASRVGSMPIYGDGDALDSLYTTVGAGKNIFTQYIRYCYNVFLKFDMGWSSSYPQSITSELGFRTRYCIALLSAGVGATLLVGIPLGVYIAVHKNKKRDRIINAILLFLSAIPNYTVAILLTLYLCVYLRVLPLNPNYTQPIAFLLPALTLSLGGVAAVARMTRTSMIETFSQPFITALSSKGLGESSVIYKHALKNALIPVISSLKVLISQLLFGTLVVENFFNVPGLGSYSLRAINARASFEILGCVVVLTLILSVTSLLSDIIYAAINPRIKLRYVEKRKQRKRAGA